VTEEENDCSMASTSYERYLLVMTVGSHYDHT
jgi:hypothetical protein